MQFWKKLLCRDTDQPTLKPAPKLVYTESQMAIGESLHVWMIQSREVGVGVSLGAEITYLTAAEFLRLRRFFNTVEIEER